LWPSLAVAARLQREHHWVVAPVLPTKGTDLSIHSHAHVAQVMEELNTRPRKLLRYRTPKQALHAENRPPTVTFKSLNRRVKQPERCNDYSIPPPLSG